MVLLTLKLSLVLAACCKVDVINGGLGLIDIGFFETSEIFNDDELINSTISLAKEIVELINSSSLKISDVSKKPISIKPRPPFITSTLQQAASTKLSFNVKRTMRVAQKLYEAGYITYMRTDAPSLSKESIHE